VRRILSLSLVALAVAPAAGGVAGKAGEGVEPQQIALAVKPNGAFCQYTRSTAKELCAKLGPDGAYPVKSGSQLTFKANAHVPMPPGWKLFMYRDRIGPQLGAPGPSACDAAAHRCFSGPPRHTGKFKPPYVCGPTTSAICGPVTIPGRRVASTVYEVFRAVVLMANGKSFEASFYLQWHP
jgi:hypothetical protein